MEFIIGFLKTHWRQGQVKHAVSRKKRRTHQKPGWPGFLLKVLVLLVVLLSQVLPLGSLTPSVLAAFLYAGDEFNTVAYNNQDGTVNWLANWTEVSDNGLPASGNVMISNGLLRLDNHDGGAVEGISRQVNLTSATRATLTFDFRTSNTLEEDGTDVFGVYVNGTSVGTISGDAQGSRAYDITGLMTSTTTILLQINAGYTAADEYIYFNNVRVTYYFDSTHTASKVLQTVQTYYIPLPEDDLIDAITTIYDVGVCGSQGIYNPAAPINTYIGISIVADNTIIYVDHWEDDFEPLINDPIQASSDIWGDNDMSNGAPPGYTTDVLSKGTIILVKNPVDPTTRQTVYDYDGGDKFASTEAIAITRLGWASGSDTLLAGAIEVLDTSVWGTSFDMPVGVNTANMNNMFQYTGVMVMAAEDNTSVSYNGTQVATLDEGETYFRNDGVNQGDTVTTSANVQVHLLTGDECANFESRYFTLYPTTLWSDSYYTPVSTDTTNYPTYVFLYNPNAGGITVQWETTSGSQTPVNVPAGGTTRAIIPNGSGAHFYTTDGSVFYAVGTIDSEADPNNQAADWGFALIPGSQLTQQALIGYGYGQDPTKTQTENGSPVWVTVDGAGGPFNVCVDYDGDAAGSLTDSNGRNYDALLTLNRLQRSIVYEPMPASGGDGDQTSMLLYVCDGSDAEIAVAWGQDPAVASAGTPGFDLGTTVPPLPNFTAVKNADLTNDLNGDDQFDVGETFEYQITIRNTGALPIPAYSIDVADIIPQYTLYVPNSTEIYSSYTDTTTPLADDSVPPASTAFPLDEGGYTIPTQLWFENYFEVRFSVKIDASLPGSTTIQNQAYVSGLDLVYDPDVEIVVEPPDENSRIGDFIWLDLNGDGLQSAGEPGIPGVTMELYDGSCILGSTCLTDVTDSDGIYGFPNLLEGVAYTVIVQTASLPAGLALTGDPDSTADGQHTVTLSSSNKPYLDADFGYQGNLSIGDFVWYDLDRDGVQDGGSEVGLDGVTVNLTWAGLDGNLLTTDDNLTFTMVTAGGGAYDFTGLPAGTYQVDLDESTLPANYRLTTTDPLTLTNLSSGTDYNDADFGAAPGATIGDYVWNDMDGAGDQDATESGIAGVRVFIDENGNDSYDPGEPNTLTNANGAYTIGGLAAGTYTVRVDAATVPAGFTATTSQELSVTVAEGENYVLADFGYQADTLSISKVSDAGGNVDPGDTINYTITVQNNSGAQQSGITITDALPAGTSYVSNSTVANGYTNTIHYARDEFSSLSYSRQDGDRNLDWAADWVENDPYGTAGPNGDYVGITGERLFLHYAYVNDERIERSVDLTSYASAVLSFDWATAGIDAGECVAVRVYDGSSWTTLTTFTGSQSDTFTADISGYMSSDTRVRFANEDSCSDNWENGEYAYFDNVQVTAATTPSAITRDNIPVGANPDLSDGVPASLVTAGDNFVLDDGQSMTVVYQVTVDDPVTVAGLTSIDNTAQVTSTQQSTPQEASTSDALPQAGLGDRVWIDANANGLQDSGESGLDGVLVTLYESDGATFVASTTTSGGGLYSFTVPAGDYVVGFSNLPAGYFMTPQDAGGDDAVDSDANITTGKTGTITLYADQTDNTIDAGVYQHATIGDFVWNDLDGDGIQDAGEGGINGVTVTLYESDGSTVITTTTTANDGSNDGAYSFTNLVPGEYVVGFSNLPAGSVFTTRDSGGDDAVDSDADRVSGKTGTITLVSGQANNTVDAGLHNPNTAVIGDYVWLDEDGDGLQDAGETGIPNVTLELRDGSCTPGSTCATTVSDENGSYLFNNLQPGSYTVAVVGGLPAGLSSNPTYDEDGTGTANTIAVTIITGEEHRTADFGYNWATTADVTNPLLGTTGAIGDRVWIDADGDGMQDAHEAGLAGVTVTLVQPGADGLFGTADDDTSTTTTTDAAGNYIFDGLAAGAYQVQVSAPSGYDQTGDPDYYNTTIPSGEEDNQTTAPIILAPGDVYVNADFGYQPSGGSNTIGNQLFVDSNADGDLDAGEPGIANVTVALLDGSGNVIAATITDENGQYGFAGLPDGTYTVWVNDTENILGGLVQNSTPDNSTDGGQPCGACSNQNTVTVSGSGNDYQDFGYVPFGHSSGNGLIGDTVFLDRDADGNYDPGEGLEGITVRLYSDSNADGNYDSGEPVLAATQTDENGQYYFGGLAAGDYVVKVDETTLPAGLTNTVDVGDSAPSEGGLTLASGGINLDQDFGYRDTSSPNTIGGTLWEDTDADGSLEGGETGRFSGVTIVLRDSSGNIVATTTTDGSGNYSFTNLPDGTYTVDVSDDGNLLNAYWHSTGSSPGSDNNSQADPYSVTVTGGQTNTTGDFGYYIDPSQVSDYVWLDRDNDGVQESNEPGIEGVKVTLTAVYPNGDSFTVSVFSDQDGLYTFKNLLNDESYNLADDAGGTPTFTISFTAPHGTTASPTGQGTSSTDSNGVSTVVNPLAQGQSDNTYDSGFYTLRLDLGDLPDTYGTLFEPGPAHVIYPDGADADSNPDTTGEDAAVWLGVNVDVETDGAPSVDADGDDAAGSDDEDGLSLGTAGDWTAGNTATATVIVNGSESGTTVYFGLWFDWDNNGSLEDFYSGSGVTGSPMEVPVSVSVPASYVADSTVYIRVRAHTAPFVSADSQGTRVNGEVEDYYIEFPAGGVPTPVTLSYFSASRQGNRVSFEWSTATETGNLGFNLYAEDEDGEKVWLNDQLIVSSVIDSLERQDYSYSAAAGGRVFYIEDVSILDERRMHGPFELGERYGDRQDENKVDWDGVTAAHAAAAPPSIKGKGNGRFGNTGLGNKNLGLGFKLEVRETGLYRVSYEEILAQAGGYLDGVPVSQITLTNRGHAVPVYISGNGRFGPGEYIEFYGEALDTLYTDTNIYELGVSKAPAAQVKEKNAKPTSGTDAVWYAETLHVNRQNAYVSYSPGDDPWYDTRMLVYGAANSWEYPIEVEGLADANGPATLELVVWGLTSWPEVDPDHHLQVSLNGVSLAGGDVVFDGLSEKRLRLEVPAGTLLEGQNRLQLRLPGDSGANFDLISLDRYSLSYPRRYTAQAGQLAFSAAGENFRVSGLPDDEVVVYRLDEDGMTRLDKIEVEASGDSYAVRFAGVPEEADYLVASAGAMYDPNFKLVITGAALDVPAEYLILSHADFISGLGPLVQARRAQGLSVNVVDVEEVYEQYGNGIFDPQAIKAYIAYAAAELGTEYVLLVGGDTYDYRNYLGVDSLSFIPSLYAETGEFAKYSPVDGLYADVDGDNVPDLAIGRFPVRTQVELGYMVNKTLAYEGKDYVRTAVFAADTHDGAVSFKDISQEISSGISAGWSVEHIYLDDVDVAAARGQLLDAMNGGTALVSYTGHSGPMVWSFSSLFNNADAAGLVNDGRPFVSMQWGCWNSYYVDPVNDYLVQGMLLSGEQGAAAMLGAVARTDSDSERLLGARLAPHLTAPGVSIGTAVRDAKQELAQGGGAGLVDVLLGWSLMGDPALVIEPGLYR
ncbi:MAG: carboxypeptidase regulatory-like domain-containing protein [Anaerolineales bacterium]|nr:carboxypeptidase regulatory-like domain-containing protein [Anaerolineales bacterium]